MLTLLLNEQYSLLGFENMVRVSDKLIRQMADDIVKEVAPEKVILFGSWARGCGGDESDVDFLVIEREAFGPHRSRNIVCQKIF